MINVMDKTGKVYASVIQITHIIPLNDTIKHIPDSSCKCGHKNEMHGNDIMVSHIALDGRLEIESLTGFGIQEKGWITLVMTTQDNLKTSLQTNPDAN